jgi:hypothetical protein
MRQKQKLKQAPEGKKKSTGCVFVSHQIVHAAFLFVLSVKKKKSHNRIGASL